MVKNNVSVGRAMIRSCSAAIAGLLIASPGLRGPNCDATETWNLPSAIATAQWQLVAGANGIALDGDVVHVWHKAAGDTDRPSRATLDLPIERTAVGSQMEFSVRFGELRSLGAFVEISDGSRRVLFMGADGVYNSMGADLDGKRVWQKPGDSQWHTVKLAASEESLELSIDGRPVGSSHGLLSAARMTFGSRAGASGWQTEAWLRLTKATYAVDAGAGRAVSENISVSQQAVFVSDVGTMPAEPRQRPIPAAQSLASRQLVALGGVDTKAQAPIQLVGGARPRLTARSSSIKANPLSIVEFAPVVDRPDFVPVDYYFVVNGATIKQLAVFPTDKPTFALEVPAGAGLLTRVRIVAEDAKRLQQEVLRAEVRTADPAQATSIRLALDGQKVVLKNLPQTVKSVFVFAGSEYIGQLTDPKAFAVDARRIPAGQHEFYVVAQDGYGDLLPAVRSLIEIKPRYTVTSPLSEGVFMVEGHDVAMRWTFTRLPDDGVAKTRVYLRGTLIAESEKSVFDVDVPLADVPSGDAELQVMGVAADGTIYASESRFFSVRNPFNDALVARDQRAKKLQEMIRQMSYYDQQVAYWYSKAISEPESRTYTVDEFGRMCSVSYLHTLTVPGHAGEYFAKCEAAIVERAEFRLEIGKLQKRLVLRAQARSTFEQVIYEVGADSGLGLAAAQELASM